MKQIAKVAAGTLEDYDRRAEEFWQGTRDHDVRQNIDALLRHIHGEPPFTILDLGCGPGRDLVAFTALCRVVQLGIVGAEAGDFLSLLIACPEC